MLGMVKQFLKWNKFPEGKVRCIKLIKYDGTVLNEYGEKFQTGESPDSWYEVFLEDKVEFWNLTMTKKLGESKCHVYDPVKDRKPERMAVIKNWLRRNKTKNNQ